MPFYCFAMVQTNLKLAKTILNLGIHKDISPIFSILKKGFPPHSSLGIPLTLSQSKHINLLLSGGMYVHAMACAYMAWCASPVFQGAHMVMSCTLWWWHDPLATGPRALRIQHGREGFLIGKPRVIFDGIFLNKLTNHWQVIVYVLIIIFNFFLQYDLLQWVILPPYRY